MRYEESDEFKLLCARVDELFDRAAGDLAASRFLTPAEQYFTARRLAASGRSVRTLFFGGAPGAQRKKLFVLPDYLVALAEDGDLFDTARQFLGEDAFGDIQVLKLSGGGFRDFSHRDYLGSLLSLGIERRREMLYALLRGELSALGVNVSCIYERNESPIREKEGMICGKGAYAAPGLETSPSGHAEICENGIYFDVDYINGQKTGYFLDQKYNRAAAGRLAHGRRVLDCFTHTGAFALHCAAFGAESVTAVDVSASALEQARRNAERNGLQERVEFRQADVFELLTELGKSGEKPWDYIILDPPAFTKSGATVENARRGYREINRRAMQILPRGGYLATCSCSHFMTDTLFRAMLADAARDASVQLRQIEARTQSPDHPILWGVPETDYLKFYLFQVV